MIYLPKEPRKAIQSIPVNVKFPMNNFRLDLDARDKCLAQKDWDVFKNCNLSDDQGL